MSVRLKQTHKIKTNDSFKIAPRPEYFGKSAVWEGNVAAGAPCNAFPFTMTAFLTNAFLRFMRP